MKPSQSLSNKQAFAPYKSAITRYIRSAMVLKGKKYDDLVIELEARGIFLTTDNLRSKVSKGMFSADLLVAIIDVLEVQENAMRDILKQVKND